MKKFILIISAFALALFIACEGGGGGTATGEGGPDVSPDDIQSLLGGNSGSSDQPVTQVSTDVTDPKDEVSSDVTQNSDINELTDSKPGDDPDDSSDSTSDNKSDKIISQVDTTITEALKLAAAGNFIQALNNLQQLKKEIQKSDIKEIVGPLVSKIAAATKQVNDLKKTYDSEQLQVTLAEIDSIMDRVADYLAANDTTEAKKLLEEALAKAKALTDADAKTAALAKVEKALDDLEIIEKNNTTSKAITDAIASGDFNKALDAARDIAEDTALANALVAIINAVTGKDVAKKVLKEVVSIAENIKTDEIKNNVIDQATLQLSDLLSYELIPQEGKWFEVDKKELFTKDEWQSKKQQI